MVHIQIYKSGSNSTPHLNTKPYLVEGINWLTRPLEAVEPN